MLLLNSMITPVATSLQDQMKHARASIEALERMRDQVDARIKATRLVYANLHRVERLEGINNWQLLELAKTELKRSQADLSRLQNSSRDHE